jgi:hypothetical protein
MYFLKQCPRCNGDLAAGSDQYGDYVSCLQCGLCEDVSIGASGSPTIDPKPVNPSVAAVLSRDGYRINALQPASGRLPVGAH